MPQSFENIRVFRIAHTTVDKDEVQRWLDDMGADEFHLEDYSDISDPGLLVALAAKQCYMAFQPSLNPNLTKVRKDMVDYLDNVLKQGHGSVLTHAWYTYAINGCSRVFTGENNRHTVGTSISERSMRYVRYDRIDYWMPPVFRADQNDDEELADKKERSRQVMAESFSVQEDAMAEFSMIWEDELAGTDFHVKKRLTSAFRRVIGMGIATGGVWSGNLRSFRHMIAMRTDPSAEEEIVEVYRQLGRDLISRIPEIFGDFEDRDGALVPAYWKV